MDIVHDTSYLDVSSVKLGVDASFSGISSRATGPNGASPCTSDFPKVLPRERSSSLEIDLATTSKCTALQWLCPAQTSNKKAASAVQPVPGHPRSEHFPLPG